MAEILNQHGPGYTHVHKLPHIGTRTDLNHGGLLNENLMEKNTDMSPQINSGLVIENIH
jgi:hypothetical protein